jgi:transposase
LGGAIKKTPEAYERDREDLIVQRRAFAAAQPSLPTKRLVFVDESGYRLGGTPRYGWSPRGVDAPGKVVCGKWKQVTILGAIALDGLRGCMTIMAGTSTAVFLAFIEQVLGPQLRPGDVLVMDNLAAHKNSEVIAAIASFGAKALFIPPYSPEFNPIEKTWAKLKDILRRCPTRLLPDFDHAITEAFKQITVQDIEGWTRHAGYEVSLL